MTVNIQASYIKSKSQELATEGPKEEKSKKISVPWCLCGLSSWRPWRLGGESLRKKPK
jgi:hypothetical protein